MRDERDPIENVRSMLVEGGHATEDDLKAIDKEIKEIVNATAEFAKTLASRNPGPIAAGKAALDAHLGLPLDQAYAMATPVMIGHFMDAGRLAAERDSKFG